MGTYFSSSKGPAVVQKAEVVLKEFKLSLPGLLLRHVPRPSRPSIPRWAEVDYAKTRGRHASFFVLPPKPTWVVTITPPKQRRKCRKRPKFYREVPIQSWSADI